MKISVDHDRCEGHAACVLAAPTVFALDDDGVVAYAYEGTTVPEGDRSDALLAVESCPVAALRVG